MKIVDVETYSYGVLYTSMGKWELLEPEPQKHNLPHYLRNDAYRFHVVNDDGFDSKADVLGSFVVILHPQLKSIIVKVVVDDDIESSQE